MKSVGGKDSSEEVELLELSDDTDDVSPLSLDALDDESLLTLEELSDASLELLELEEESLCVLDDSLEEESDFAEDEDETDEELASEIFAVVRTYPSGISRIAGSTDVL